MQHKIYISLKEAEELVFNKLTVIPATRLQIIRAQKDLSIAVFVAEKELIEFESQVFLLAGAILTYEIPPQEENLFLNHYRVPKGLIVLKPRKYRESEGNTPSIHYPNEAQYEEEIKVFKSMRRAALQCYILGVNNHISQAFSAEAILQINTMNNLSEFQYRFIKAIILNEFYPVKEKNDGKFYSEAVKRFNWFGAFIFREFPGILDLDEINVKESKQWFLNFKEKDDSASILRALGKVPEIFSEDFEFLIGYYMAASFYEETDTGNEYYRGIEAQLKKMKYAKNNKVFFWAIFFQALFKDALDFLYVIPSYQKQQLLLEHKIIGSVFSDMPLSDVDLDMTTITREEAIAEYLQLQDGKGMRAPTFISKGNERELLENNLSRGKILNIGYERGMSDSLDHVFGNKCSVNGRGFNLSLIQKPANTTFYVNERSKVIAYLKDLKIKTKPISKLIDKNKKALVGFLTPESYNRSLLKVYEWITQHTEQPIEFKAIVIVLLVDEEIEYLQSSKFQTKKLEMEMFCKSKFGDHTTVVVKNKRVRSDAEIKRNLKHVLKQFRIKDIELIDENIDDTMINWVLSVNNEYVNEENLKDVYALDNS